MIDRAAPWHPPTMHAFALPLAYKGGGADEQGGSEEQDTQDDAGEALLDAMPPETAEEIERAWIEEARRRAGRLERGEVQARGGETVLASLEAKLRGLHSK